MKMGMKKGVLLVALIFGALLLAACGSGSSNSVLEGTWMRISSSSTFSDVLTFSGDSFTEMPSRYGTTTRTGTFTIADDRVELRFDEGSSGVHRFEVTGNSLTISGLLFQRQE